MSPAADLLHTIAGLREAVVAGVRDLPADVRQELAPLSAAAPALARDESGRLSLVTVDVAGPLELADLEAAYGSASRLPRRPSGGRRTVQFPATIPAEGSTGATVLAELDESGRAVRIIIRRDEL